MLIVPSEAVYLPCDEEYPQRSAGAFLSVVAYPDALAEWRQLAA